MVLGKNDLNNYLTQYKHCKNVTYIYNPIAVDTCESTPLTQKRAIAVGRLSRQKGFDMLVEAWALIEKEVPDWKLDIYGQGPLQKELQGQIDGLGLRNIELKGFSDDIHKEYMESSLFFLSSRYEGFVLVLMGKQKSLKLNFVMNAILTMSQFIFPLITFPYVSRILLPAGTGKVSFATSIVSYFTLFAQLGIPTYGIRACAKVRDNREELSKMVQELFIINLVMSMISLQF